MTKGILLAGGHGTRLGPLTIATNKHLLPVYDKPMIYYPLTTLMLAGLKDIALITNPQHSEHFFKLLGFGDQWGIKLSYLHQQSPGGIPEALVIAEQWLDGQGCALILGDNIFYGAGLGDLVQNIYGPTIFTKQVKDPERYGILEEGKVIEKPKHPKSNWAVTGLYFFNHNAVDDAKRLGPSDRGELEIADLINRQPNLGIHAMGRGFAWFDAGTPDSLLQASNFIQVVQERQGLEIGNPLDIAKHMGFVCDTAGQSTG